MMKKALLSLIIILLVQHIQSQKEELDLRTNFIDAEFFIDEEEYIDALYDYLELYNNGFKDNANINYRVGICYLNILGQKEKSINYLIKATQNIKSNNRPSEFKEEKSPMDAWLFLGNAYRVNNKLDKAIEAYQTYKDMLPSSDKDDINFINQQIEACKVAIEFIKNPIKIKKTNLGNAVNGISSNFKPVVSGDGKTLVYMNELPFYDAIYHSTLEDGSWSEPTNITPQIQSDGNQLVTFLSWDGKTLILTKEDNFNSDIYISKFENGVWTKSEPISKNINSRFWESNASLTKDSKTLYFASNHRSGIGGSDIYKSVLEEDGEWSKPILLGTEINTPLNEDAPIITEDGKSLYFSSQGHLTMGGYDYFVSHLNENNNWSKAKNLGYPLSTTDDDVFYYPWNNGAIGYVSLLETEGYGKEDIYKIEFVSEIDEEVTELIKEQDQVSETDTIIPQEEIAIIDRPLKDTVIIPEEIQTEKPKEIQLKEYSLSYILFDFDSYKLNPVDLKTIETIVEIMENNEEITLRLTGHTDAIGTNQYNQVLSEKRAKAVLQAIISKGIDVSRIRYMGKGESQFIAINKNADGTDNMEGRKYNRRVEFEFIGYDVSKLKISLNPIPDNLKLK